ncbi:hypothetical protein FRC08_014106 [Ceratobasidium sp. 394]|nr:hypothetical protein FRC08_014106 [Ceratobasidium sp. 394]
MIPSLTDSGGCGCSSCRPSAKQWDESSTKERAKRLKGLKEKWDKGTLSKDLPAFKPTVKIPKEKKVDAKEEVKDGSEGEKKDEAKDEKKDEAKGEAKEEAKDESKDETESEDDSDDSESSSDSESSESESSKKDDSNHERKLDGYFRVCIVAPATRSSKLERAAREKRRRELNELMLRMMVGAKGGEIGSGAAPESEEDGDLVKGWAERLVESDALKDVVDRALGMAMLADLEQGEEEQEKVLVSWAQLQDSWKAKHSGDEERKAWTAADGSDDEGSDEEKKKEDEEEKPPVDEVIEKVKAADLDEYEQRLVGCIVDVGKLPTTFENVHLPMQVIDSVRSIVSLPLLFPDAFKSGILKQQAISGALLFGPPGTGKTLVVRALAKESGARMLAIKPSDIADKWVGETEKLVKSLFKLARRLKPCVVFIDEIDSLMGSRQSKACGGSARWHTSMLTEFMQEMDGLMASSVIVIGATNRPFDIDDAVLRRLPCRLLVDLPGERAREEILKIMLRDDKLGPDVSISELAKKTDRFSGSDLKHLCVAAAMDALKESVKLPWATKKEESKDAPSANGAPVAGAKPAANGATESEKDAAKPASSDASDDDSSVPSSSEPSSGSSTPPSSGITTPGEEPAKSEPEPPKPRLLEARHFTRALMDIAPSSSESQGSLSDLRKWNTQFGTGAREQPQTRGAGSLPYSYGGAKASGAGLSGVNGVSSYGGLGSSGLGSGGGYGSTSLGASGLGLGSGAGFGSSGLGSSGYGSSGYGASGLGASGPGYGAAGGGYTPTYTPPSAGGASAGTGSAPKFPVYTRNIPGYNPSAPGDGSSAPGL